MKRNEIYFFKDSISYFKIPFLKMTDSTVQLPHLLIKIFLETSTCYPRINFIRNMTLKINI